MCGENGRPALAPVWRAGSSPRVRGKQPRNRTDTSRFGLIPACAGKTLMRSSSPALHSAHPRVCGENRDTQTNGGTVQGSSPRVRGKRSTISVPGSLTRLIPACAGKTVAPVALLPPSGAHPRVCGENYLAAGDVGRHLGSSPRVRGKQRARFIRDRACGLIPACAGKTLCARLAGR